MKICSVSNTNNKESEREIKIIRLYNYIKKNIIPRRINFTKKVKDLYSENCKILMKETEEGTNEWKDSTCS